MDHKGLLVLVFGLGAAIGAVVQWTELNEAKVGKKQSINGKMTACEGFRVFFAGLFDQVWLPERCSRPRRPSVPGGGDRGPQVNTVSVITCLGEDLTGTGSEGVTKLSRLIPQGFSEGE